MSEIKDVQSCAKSYMNLLNKRYRFTIEGNIEFEIKFKESNFYHIMGLHKLKDIPELVLPPKDCSNENVKNSPKEIYRKILNSNIPNEMVEKSANYKNISDRVENFEKIFDTLDPQKSKIIIDFDYSKVEGTTLTKTKYILYTPTLDGYFLFTLGMSRNIIYPETIFCENSKKYNSEQTLLDIIDIVEIKNNKKRKRKK